MTATELSVKDGKVLLARPLSAGVRYHMPGRASNDELPCDGNDAGAAPRCPGGNSALTCDAVRQALGIRLPLQHGQCHLCHLELDAVLERLMHLQPNGPRFRLTFRGRRTIAQPGNRHPGRFRRLFRAGSLVFKSAAEEERLVMARRRQIS